MVMVMSGRNVRFLSYFPFLPYGLGVLMLNNALSL